MDQCAYCGGALGVDRIESSGGGFRHYSKIDCCDCLLIQRKALELQLQEANERELQQLRRFEKDRQERAALVLQLERYKNAEAVFFKAFNDFKDARPKDPECLNILHDAKQAIAQEQPVSPQFFCEKCHYCGPVEYPHPRFALASAECCPERAKPRFGG